MSCLLLCMRFCSSEMMEAVLIMNWGRWFVKSIRVKLRPRIGYPIPCIVMILKGTSLKKQRTIRSGGRIQRTKRNTGTKMMPADET